MRIKTIFIALTLLLFQGELAARQHGTSLPKESSLLSFAQQVVVPSAVLGKNCSYNIYLPESFHQASKDHTYPVLLLLEDEFFFMVSGVVKHLSSVERMPETIVVSVPDMSYMPTVYTNGSTFWPMEQLADENPDPFTKHLRDELFPYLEATYRANNFRMIMGLSPTSVYVFHTFVKEPDLFSAHIAIAAGDMLGMGYQKGERFIDLLSDEVKGNADKKRYLYVTSADSDGGGESPEIESNLKELDQVLGTNSSENLRFISKIFPNEGHYDVALPALLEALDLIFPKDDWSARYRDIVSKPGNALQNIDNHYQQLSALYGFTILPRAERWNSVNRLSWVGPYLVRQGRIAEGIEVVERWAAYRPESALAFGELAKAYEAGNEFEKALAAITSAYDLSKKEGSENTQQYLQHLEELKVKVNGK